MNLNAYCDEVTALVHPLEVWQVDVPEKTIGSYRVTLSFFGQSYYKPDIDKKKYTSYEKIDSILTGFETVSWIGNKNIAPNCHFPTVNIRPITGIRYTDGVIRLSGVITDRIYSGTSILLGGSYNIEIDNIDGDEADFTISEMDWSFSNRPLQAERIGPLKIHKESITLPKVK